jgi:triosephosphate isomerase
MNKAPAEAADVARALSADLAGVAGVDLVLCPPFVALPAVGEVLAENEAGQTTAVVTRQTQGAFAGLPAEDALKSVIAYEPVWAKGTWRAATAEGANAVIRQIRAVVAALYSPDAAAAIRIQYGGSVTAANSAELMAQPEIDGTLVGGASLKPAEFLAVVRVAAK